MRHKNPWTDITPGAAGHLNVRRVDPISRHDFYFACNDEGRYVFVFNASESVPGWGAAPQLRGITVQYYEQQRQLQLVLHDRADWEIFLSLCGDLMQTSSEAITTREVLDALIGRLLRWQRLLSRGSRRALDEREIRGLIGELLFLRDELLSRLGPAAVRTWHGPEGLPQDFAVGRFLFEVKTHLAGSDPSVTISSVEQLSGAGNPLALVVVPLARCGAGAAGAESLPRLVAQITGRLEGTAERELFDDRLADAGYLPLQEYEEKTYRPSNIDFYEVRDGFPMIEPSAVPAGVVDVRYAIRLGSCKEFRYVPSWGDVVEGVR